MIQDIPGWLSENEGQLLAYFAKRAKGLIVEIGSFCGKSTVYMARETNQKIYAIDPFLGKTHINKKSLGETYKIFLKNIKKFKVDSKINVLKKTSAQAHKGWNKPIDLLHIDGLHEYKYVKQDLQMWLPNVVDGGVIICHDAFAPYPEVWQAVKEEIFDNNFGYVGINDSQIFAIKNKENNFQKPFIIFASNIWHNKRLPYKLRDFIVKRILKPFYLNKFMLKAIVAF